MAIELFGNSATFNPFTGQVNLKRVADVVVPIPETVNFIGQDFVSVDLSFVPTRSSVLSLSVEVIDTDGSTIQILTPSIGDGEIQPPTATQAIWIDINGYRGTLWINGAYVGKRLKFTGDFQSSVLSGRVYNNVANSIVLLNKVILQTAGTYKFSIQNTFDFGDLIIPSSASFYEYMFYPASGGGGSGANLSTEGINGSPGGSSEINLFQSETIQGKAGGNAGIFEAGVGAGTNGGGIFGGKGGKGRSSGGDPGEDPSYNPFENEPIKKIGSINSYSTLEIILGIGGAGGASVGGYSRAGTKGGDAQIEISFFQRVF